MNYYYNITFMMTIYVYLHVDTACENVSTDVYVQRWIPMYLDPIGDKANRNTVKNNISPCLTCRFSAKHLGARLFLYSFLSVTSSPVKVGALFC